ncbi:MAG TPA: chemotaxis protein CheW [Candidatus Angelobacter sp.]
MREQPPRPRPGVHEGVILFSVGGFKFAIAAGAVNEIRGMEGLQDFTLRGISARVEKLRHTLERSGTTYFVVDAARHFHLSQSAPTRVLILRNSLAAVLVDSTDRMMDIFTLHALPRAFTGDERVWYRGLAVVNGEVVPVVNAGAFLSKAEQELLRDGLERVRGLAAV